MPSMDGNAITMGWRFGDIYSLLVLAACSFWFYCSTMKNVEGHCLLVNLLYRAEFPQGLTANYKCVGCQLYSRSDLSSQMCKSIQCYLGIRDVCILCAITINQQCKHQEH